MSHTLKIYFPSTDCYACDEPAVGVADRRHAHQQGFMPACERHAEPGAGVLQPSCAYCEGATTETALSGIYSHTRCHKANR